jgi:[ribosomal protein S18]-alanine N-acetyltransferase
VNAFAFREATCLDVATLLAAEPILFGTDGWSEATWWSELAGRPRREYVVADVDGRIAGYAGLDAQGDTADVMTIAVLPEHQGKGLGRALLAWLQERAAARGATNLLLEVRADNEPARMLYEQAGFVRISVRRKYYQPGDVDAIIMRKALSQ